jgi:hypothetical protein
MATVLRAGLRSDEGRRRQPGRGGEHLSRRLARERTHQGVQVPAAGGSCVVVLGSACGARVEGRHGPPTEARLPPAKASVSAVKREGV